MNLGLQPIAASCIKSLASQYKVMLCNDKEFVTVNQRIYCPNLWRYSRYIFKCISIWSYVSVSLIYLHKILNIIDFSLIVKAAHLIFISGPGSTISSAKEGNISFLGRANVCAFHENPNRIPSELTFINP